jgi:hypothetical protein
LWTLARVFDGLAFQSGYALLPGKAIETESLTLLNNTSKNKYRYNISYGQMAQR